MSAARCKHCDKNTYSEANAYRAAINSSRTLGKAMRVYRCPYDETKYHLTTQEKAGTR